MTSNLNETGQNDVNDIERIDSTGKQGPVQALGSRIMNRLRSAFGPREDFRAARNRRSAEAGIFVVEPDEPVDPRNYGNM